MKSVIEIFHEGQEAQRKIFMASKRALALTLAKMHPALEALDIARTLYGDHRLRVLLVGSTVVVAFKVEKGMAEVTPLLDLLEQELGIVFDRTVDRAELNWREFHAKDAPWIRVDAELTEDTEACRREVVRYEQAPVYELRCGDASALSGEKPTA